MQIQIREREVRLNAQLRQHIERRIHFALERFAERIRKVQVQLRDVNGPRGGIDKNCQMTVYLEPGAPVVLQRTSASPYAAIASLADKAATSIVRKLQGGQQRNRRRPCVETGA